MMVDGTAEVIQSGRAAACPACLQAVEVKLSGSVRSFVPHFLPGQRKMCPKSGKSVGDPEATSGVQKLAAYMTRELIKVVACRSDGEPTIELLNLEYLNKNDRVRLQIAALRDILGESFQMKPYPGLLRKPHLAVWGNTAMCVIAKTHDKGGYQPMTDAELFEVVKDIRAQQSLFFF